MQQNGQQTQAMLDQKQNWLVSGAYLSHIFRLERHRNHHVETHAQTYSHINTKIHAHANTKKNIAEGQPSMIVYGRLCGFQSHAPHARGDNVRNHHRQCSIRSRTGLYLVLICHMYLQTGVESKSSHRDLCTNTLAHKHKNTPTHKHRNKHNRRTTLHDRL